jgi:uncharacterized protein YciI
MTRPRMPIASTHGNISERAMWGNSGSESEVFSMPYFVVTRERGGDWDWSVPMRRQAEWDAHARFMDALVDEGFVVAGGPLGGEDDAARVLHVVSAPEASAIDTRLAQDPWTAMRLLKTVSIEPWTVLLGGFARPAS